MSSSIKSYLPFPCLGHHLARRFLHIIYRNLAAGFYDDNSEETGRDAGPLIRLVAKVMSKFLIEFDNIRWWRRKFCDLLFGLHSAG